MHQRDAKQISNFERRQPVPAAGNTEASCIEKGGKEEDVGGPWW